MSDETQAPTIFRAASGREVIRHDRTALLASPIVQEIVREERERCAQIAVEMKKFWLHGENRACDDIAAAIRKGEE